MKDLSAYSADSRYDLISAVRGPDGGEFTQIGGVLKWHVTCRIRSILFRADEVNGADYNDLPLDRKHLDLLKDLLASGGPVPEHYLSHLLLAVRVSVHEPIWGGLATELYDLLREARNFAARQASKQHVQAMTFRPPSIGGTT